MRSKEEQEQIIKRALSMSLDIAEKATTPVSDIHGKTDVVGSGASVVDQIVEDGEIIAVLIYSKILEAHIWLAFDDDFDPADGQAVFYGHELEFLKTKTPEQLRKIHALKVGAKGLGSKVRQ